MNVERIIFELKSEDSSIMKKLEEIEVLRKELSDLNGEEFESSSGVGLISVALKSYSFELSNRISKIKEILGSESR